jgi:hypothetical protein
MPGAFLHAGATVICSHGGFATPTTTYTRVLLSGMPAILLSTPYTITNCPHMASPTVRSPCLTGTWLTGSTRVLSYGQPLVLRSGTSTCVPNGAPLLAIGSQARVVGD